MASVKVLKRIIVNGNEYIIVKKEGWFLAIDKQFVKDGILTKNLNGLQMFASKTLEECIKKIKRKDEMTRFLKENAYI